MKIKFSFLSFVLLALLGYLPSKAQQYFNKRYTAGAASNIFSSALERNGKYYVIMAGVDSSNHIGGGLFTVNNGLRFIVLDKEGDILHSTLHKLEDKRASIVIPAPIPLSNNLKLLDDGSFLYAIAFIDTALAPYNPSNRNTGTAILRFDSLGNVLHYREYDRAYCLASDATNHLLCDFKPDGYGNWLMLSSMLCKGNSVVFNLRKLDSNYNEIWVKNFTTNSLHHIPKQLLIEEDGYVMSGGIDNGNLKLFPDYYASVLIKCDTSGTQLWTWKNDFDTAQIQYIINDIVRSKDGGYIYCGSGDGKPALYATGEWADVYTKGWIEKLDASRKSVWKTSFGEVRAQPKFTSQNVLRQLPSGDLIVAGSVVHPIDISDKTNGWARASLTKLNGADGSIIWQRLYKSPDGNDTMILLINDVRPTADGGYIMAGESRNTIDRRVGPTQRGWLIKVDSNGCEQATGSCNPLSVVTQQASTPSFQVYPNPSEGVFTLSTQAPLPSIGATVSLRIYDLAGRLILEQAIKAPNTLLDLSDYADGVYLYTLKHNGVNVANGKLLKH